MNIFVSSRSPVLCARNLDDKRLVKMVLETAQILSTVCADKGHDTGYRPTHRNHPCTRWAATSRENFEWLCRHGMALALEYDYRFYKVHASLSVILTAHHVMDYFVFLLEARTPFVNCTTYPNFPTIKAYRMYLKDKWRNDTSPRWTRRGRPKWAF